MHPASLPPEQLLHDCDETRTRRGGPGGQHRNKVETAVVLRHRTTGLSAEASERRSQSDNRRVALQRLRLRLAIEHRGRPEDRPPSARWLSRVRARRLVISADHDDYPALLAEAFDAVQQASWEMAAAADALGVSTSQLIKLFKQSSAAWTAVNRARGECGLSPLK